MTRTAALETVYKQCLRKAIGAAAACPLRATPERCYASARLYLKLIGSRHAGIQGATGEAVTAIRAIGDTIGEIHRIAEHDCSGRRAARRRRGQLSQQASRLKDEIAAFLDKARAA